MPGRAGRAPAPVRDESFLQDTFRSLSGSCCMKTRSVRGIAIACPLDEVSGKELPCQDNLPPELPATLF